MSQRDTIVPVCRLIGVGSGALLGNIKLPYTGHWVEGVTVSSLTLSAVIGAQPSSMPGNGLNRVAFQDLNFIVSAATTTVQAGDWAEGYIRVGESNGSVLPIVKTVITKPGCYNTNVLAGTTTGGAKVIMPDFSGVQITSMSLAGSAGNGVSWKTLITAASDIVALSSTYWQFEGVKFVPKDGLDGTEGFPSGTAPQDFQDGHNLSAVNDALGASVRTTFYFGQDFGFPGESDVNAQLFASSTAAGGTMNPAAASPHGASSIITITNQGPNRIVQFTPGNYNLDTSFTDTNLGLMSAGFTGAGDKKFMSGNPAQMVLSSLAGDVSAVFNITSGHAGAIFTPKISDSEAYANYVTITSLSATTGYFRVAPSSGSGYYVSGNPQTTSVLNANGSGVPGTIAGGGNTAVLSMMNGITEIDIDNHTGGAEEFAINYGVIKQSNVTGDGMKPDVK